MYTVGKIHYQMPQNEPVFEYAPKSKEKEQLKQELNVQKNKNIQIPLYLDKNVFTQKTSEIRAPHDHSLKLGEFCLADSEHVTKAIDVALETSKFWRSLSIEQRASVFLKAAEILSTEYRAVLNAATMLGQSKNVYQSEIDAICELCDFWRFQAYYALKLKDQIELISPKGILNSFEYRPLEGFIYAISPFNFTSLSANLATAPALMGNVVIWKPASTAMLSAHYVMEILQKAGLPNGVINLVSGDSRTISNIVLSHKYLAGIHFTGSTAVFNALWQQIANNLNKGIYKNYPRIVGETGGKDFVLAYKDADLGELTTALIRGAYEYQGQKCSAASRAYIPKSIWPSLKDMLVEEIKTIKVGDICDFSTFMGAVIDKKAFERIKSYIDYAKNQSSCKIIVGGACDDSKGYFIYPTLVEVTDPHNKLMEEEIFGPVLSVYVYEDNQFDEVLDLVDNTSPYGLTGSIFSKDRIVINKVTEKLLYAAGNFYINDKPTGAIVGQQPFGGSRLSGTNDKAGSFLNLLRWVTPRTIKENLVPPKNYRYTHMQES